MDSCHLFSDQHLVQGSLEPFCVTSLNPDIQLGLWVPLSGAELSQQVRPSPRGIHLGTGLKGDTGRYWVAFMRTARQLHLTLHVLASQMQGAASDFTLVFGCWRFT